MDVGVGDFELVGYGDCRIYVATSATSSEDHTESVSGIILRDGYLLIWLLVFEGETAEELEGPGFGFKWKSKRKGGGERRVEW